MSRFSLYFGVESIIKKTGGFRMDSFRGRPAVSGGDAEFSSVECGKTVPAELKVGPDCGFRQCPSDFRPGAVRKSRGERFPDAACGKD